jgi:coenzyme F420-reducing hydrogenase alpha subunit
MGNFPTLFLATVTPEGDLEYYDGVIRIVDAEGNIVADGLDPLRYATYLGEASEDWSYVKFPYYKPLAIPAASIASDRSRALTWRSRPALHAPIANCGSSSIAPKAPSANPSTTIWRA